MFSHRLIVVAFKITPTNAVCLNGGNENAHLPLVDFNPITPEMAPGAIGHPYHVLFRPLANVICFTLLSRNSAESVDSPWSAYS